MTADLYEYKINNLCLRRLAPEDVPQMLALQERMLDALPDKRWYYPSERWEFELGTSGEYVYGYFDGERLAGFAMLGSPKTRAERCYAGKLNEPAANTFDFHDVMVDPEYRRRGMHTAFLKLFESIARSEGGRAVYATVDPENGASVRNFERAGYFCVIQKPAYDGRDRRYYKLVLSPSHMD